MRNDRKPKFGEILITVVPNLFNTLMDLMVRNWSTASIDQLEKAEKNLLFSTTRLVVLGYYILLLEFLQQMEAVIPFHNDWLAKRREAEGVFVFVHVCMHVCTNPFRFSSFFSLQHVCMCVCVGVCIHAYICVCIYVYIYMHVCAHICA